MIAVMQSPTTWYLSQSFRDYVQQGAYLRSSQSRKSIPGLLVVAPITGGFTSCDPKEVTQTILAVLEESVIDLAVSLTTSSRCNVRYTNPKWFTPRVICSREPDQAMCYIGAAETLSSRSAHC